jgi:hypothetical protein
LYGTIESGTTAQAPAALGRSRSCITSPAATVPAPAASH